MTKGRYAARAFLLLTNFALFFSPAAPQVTDVCPRPAPGSAVMAPADLYSSNGKLAVAFAFRTSSDVYGNTRYCYIYQDGVQAPTLRVHPGDELVIKLKNELSPANSAPSGHSHGAGVKGDPCAGGPVSPSSTNVHFHGMIVPPLCHQDEVLHTLIQPSGPAFEYRLKIPPDHPPGLYWYHPHPHGYSEGQVLGGASGAIIIEGIELAKPEVAGLPERVLVLRDQLQGEKWEESGQKGEDPKGVSINFVPIEYPRLAPALLHVRPAEREFWRVLNASADTYFDLQLLYERSQYDYVPETMKLMAIDGAPIGSDAGSVAAPAGFSALPKRVLLPPGARAEFIVTTPPAGMPGRLVTRYYDTGPDGLVHPERIIANIISREDSPAAASTVPGSQRRSARVVSEVDSRSPSRHRKLYFSEEREDLKDPKKKAKYFLTIEGEVPRVFDMNSKQPDIVVTQGTVENWTLENRAREAHAFHIHQLHFQVLERNGLAVHEPVSRDTIDLPFWDGKGPFPSVMLRMNFRDPGIVGTFVYHCHILEHEDGGMMGSIQVRK